MILSANQKVAIGVVIGLIVGFGAGWFANQYADSFKKTAGKVSEAETGSEYLPSAVAVSGGASGSALEDERPISPPAPIAGSAVSSAVVVNDQEAGMVVEATMVTFTTPGWLVIHEDYKGGLGNALGASRFDKGVFLGEVPLLRATVAGGVYHAILYADDGDRQFDLKKDAVIKDASGKAIEDTFKAL